MNNPSSFTILSMYMQPLFSSFSCSFLFYSLLLLLSSLSAPSYHLKIKSRNREGKKGLATKVERKKGPENSKLFPHRLSSPHRLHFPFSLVAPCRDPALITATGCTTQLRPAWVLKASPYTVCMYYGWMDG